MENVHQKIGNTYDNILKKHKNFLTCYEELHTRPFPQINGPVNISSIAFSHEKSALNEQNISEEIAHIAQLCQANLRQSPVSGCRHFYQAFDDFELRWERHHEFSSYTFLVRANNQHSFNSPAIHQVCKTWLGGITGKLISAVHIEAKTAANSCENSQAIKPYFEFCRLMGSKLGQQKISLWSAMQLHQDNFNRILLVSDNIHQYENGRVIRALLELEAYRNLTLMALPVAQQVISQVNEIELELASLLQHKSIAGHNEKYLAVLSAMTAKLAKITVNTQYRFDASIAYFQIVNSRLSELNEEKIDNIQTLSAFIKRRLLPAIRTINAAKQRLEDLVNRANRASDFLRTQIDMAIAQQNQALLTSMNQRSKMQLTMQRAVEGLSVIVATYYLLVLTRYILEAVNGVVSTILIPQVIAYLVPIYLGLVWLFGKQLKKHIQKS